MRLILLVFLEQLCNLVSSPQAVSLRSFQVFQENLAKRRSTRQFSTESLSGDQMTRLLWSAQGNVERGTRKTAPSANALYPLRLLLTIARVKGFQRGLYSVDPEELTLTLTQPGDVSCALMEAAYGAQPWIAKAACVVTICADFVAASAAFPDQYPIGSRGRRYIFIEAGAVAQNLYLQASEEKIGAVLVAGFNDEATGQALGLTPPLAPVLHMCFGPKAKTAGPVQC